MKVISEHIIKKLIKEKLLENYKKKINLIFENQDTGTDDLFSNLDTILPDDSSTIFSSEGLSDADRSRYGSLRTSLVLVCLYELLNNVNIKEYLITQNVQIDNEIKNKFSGIIKNFFANMNLKTNQNFAIEKFNSEILKIKNEIKQINTELIPDFLKLILKDPTLLTSELDLNKVKSTSGAATFKNNDKKVEIIINPVYEGDFIKYSTIQTEISKSLLEALPKLFNDLEQNVSEKSSQNNNNQQSTTSAIRATNTAFSRIKNLLNLSQRQMKKLGRRIGQIANERTNTEAEKQKYQQLLLAFTLKNVDALSNKAEKTIEQLSLEQQEKLTQEADAVTIKTLLEKQKNVKITFKFNKIDFKKIISQYFKPSDRRSFQKMSNGAKNNIFRRISYCLFASYFLQQFEDSQKYIITAVENKNNIEIFDELINNTILIKKDGKDTLIKLEQAIIKKINDFFLECKDNLNDSYETQLQTGLDISNEDVSNVGTLATLISQYFNDEPIAGKYITIDYNFINYIKLKYLALEADIKSASNALSEFKIEKYDIADTSEAAQAAQVQTTTASTSQSADTSTTATTKDCFKNNNKHTDNFKLYPADKITGVATPDDYRLKIAEYLLNNSAPNDYGFINKNPDEKKAVSDKLNGLNPNQIAASLKKIYPNADKFKSNPKEAWKATYFININVDEIIANK